MKVQVTQRFVREVKHSVVYHDEVTGSHYWPKEMLRAEGVRGYPQELIVTVETKEK